MTTRQELLTMFQEKATEVAEKDFSHVTEASMIAELGIDSLGMLELIGEMERELKIKITDDELVGIHSLKELFDVVEKHKAS